MAGSHKAMAWKLEDRAKRVCARCPVRRHCLAEVLAVEEPVLKKSERRVMAQGEEKTWIATDWSAPLPVGIWGGTTPEERRARDVIHLAQCGGDPCRGCRPLEDRLDILEDRFRQQSRRFLTHREHVVG